LNHIFIYKKKKKNPELTNKFIYNSFFFSQFAYVPIFCFQNKIEDFQVVPMLFLALVSAPTVELGDTVVVRVITDGKKWWLMDSYIWKGVLTNSSWWQSGAC